MTDNEFRDAGRDAGYEIDDDARVSRGSECGAYVQAWVWIDDNHPSEDDAGEGAG